MLERSEVEHRNNVRIHGRGRETLLLAHGFGCDQNMWRFVLPELARSYRVVTFDYVGSGSSDLTAYDRQRYAGLEGYAQDVIEVCQALALDNVTLVGHSVSATIGLIASIAEPQLLQRMIMICPSPCFLNKPPEYHGGFEREDLEELINLMDKNYIGWANHLAPLVLGEQADESLTRELSGSFCSTDPVIAKAFAQATFFSDYRHLLPEVKHPSLLLQNRHASLAAVSVGEYMHQQMPQSTLRVIDAHGHCLHMSHPGRVANEILQYMAREGA